MIDPLSEVDEIDSREKRLKAYEEIREQMALLDAPVWQGVQISAGSQEKLFRLLTEGNQDVTQRTIENTLQTLKQHQEESRVAHLRRELTANSFFSNNPGRKVEKLL